jgi:hypothetical protein
MFFNFFFYQATNFLPEQEAEARMTSEKKPEAVKIFKSAEAFYRYLDRKISAQGYVLVETVPTIKPASNNSLKFSERINLITPKG